MSIIYGNTHIWSSYTSKYSYTCESYTSTFARIWSYTVPYMIIELKLMCVSYTSTRDPEMVLVYEDFHTHIWVSYMIIIYEHDNPVYETYILVLYIWHIYDNHIQRYTGMFTYHTYIYVVYMSHNMHDTHVRHIYKINGNHLITSYTYICHIYESKHAWHTYEAHI